MADGRHCTSCAWCDWSTAHPIVCLSLIAARSCWYALVPRGLASLPMGLVYLGGMKKTAAHPTTSISHDSHSSPQELRVGATLLDTTWRITIPVVLLAGIGIYADRSFGTKPWLTLVGVAIGFVFAGMLVKRQIANVADGDSAEEQK